MQSNVNWFLVPFAVVLFDRHFQWDFHWHARAFSLPPEMRRIKSVKSVIITFIDSENQIPIEFDSAIGDVVNFPLTFLSHWWCKYLNKIFFFSVTITASEKRADAKNYKFEISIAVHSNMLVLTQSMCINFYLKIHWNHTYFVPMEYLRLANTQTAAEMTFGFHFLCCTMQNSVHYGMEGFSRTRLSTENGRKNLEIHSEWLRFRMLRNSRHNGVATNGNLGFWKCADFCDCVYDGNDFGSPHLISISQKIICIHLALELTIFRWIVLCDDENWMRNFLWFGTQAKRWFY